MANAEIEMVSDTNVSGHRMGEAINSNSGVKRYFWSSALARRIIAFNLIALCVLLLGMLYLSQFRNNSATVRLMAVQSEALLYTQLLQERMSLDTSPELPASA